MKQHQNPQMRTTVDEEYRREMERIERKRQQMQDVENMLKKKEFDPDLDKNKRWEEMSSNFDRERQVVSLNERGLEVIVGDAPKANGA